MIGAIAGLSALGGSLALARAVIARADGDNTLPITSIDDSDRLQGADQALAATKTGDAPANAATTAPSSRAATSAGRAGENAGDAVEISPEGLARARAHATQASGLGEEKLSPEQKEQVRKLRERDQEVRAHEAAHKAAGGQYAGGASFSYQTGPDGARYAIGGEVSIEISEVKDNPQATIAKMQQVRAAATAPANPSGQDLNVAAKAAQIEQQARAEQLSETDDAGGETEVQTDGNAADGEPEAADSSEEAPAAHIDVYA